MLHTLGKKRRLVEMGVLLCLILILGVIGIPQSAGIITRYIDPTFLTGIPFGQRSHWIQPWRAYLETVPATKLITGLGINLSDLKPQNAAAVCGHLKESGFTHFRFEIGWNTFDPVNGTRLSSKTREKIAPILSTCSNLGLRPLILLNANQGAPTPDDSLMIDILEPAPVGATRLKVKLTGDVIDFLVPGRAGLSNLSSTKMCEVIVTSVDQTSGWITLSKPLPKTIEIPSGQSTLSYKFSRLLYEPFEPMKPDLTKSPVTVSAPSARFETTMQGWLGYVGGLAAEMKEILGTQNAIDSGFDFEIWNERFGSDFLDINTYYLPKIGPNADLEKGPATAAREATINVIRDRTAAYVKSPAVNLKQVRVIDGFVSQHPWGSAALDPCTLDGMTSHPYTGVRSSRPSQQNIAAIDSLGKLMSVKTKGVWQSSFEPNYLIQLPEFQSTLINTEGVILRNVAPFSALINGTVHGRNARLQREDGHTCPDFGFYVTEYNLPPSGEELGVPQPVSGAVTAENVLVSEKERDFLQAKSLLRFYAFQIHKGVERIYFYSAFGKQLNLLSRAVIDYVTANAGAALSDTVDAGFTMRAFKNFFFRFGTPGEISTPRSLTLESIKETHQHYQFSGNPDPTKSGSQPPLFNRELVTFLPFQTHNDRFLVPLYVMTRYIFHLQNPSEQEVTRFAMPDEQYELNIKGVNGSTVQASLYDPILNISLPVTITARTADSVTVKLGLNDSVRLLEFSEQTIQPTVPIRPISTTVPSPAAPVVGSAKLSKSRQLTLEIFNARIPGGSCSLTVSSTGFTTFSRINLSRPVAARTARQVLSYKNIFLNKGENVDKMRISVKRICRGFADTISIPARIS